MIIDWFVGHKMADIAMFLTVLWLEMRPEECHNSDECELFVVSPVCLSLPRFLGTHVD